MATIIAQGHLSPSQGCSATYNPATQQRVLFVFMEQKPFSFAPPVSLCARGWCSIHALLTFLLLSFFGWYPGEEAERWGVFARPGGVASFKAAAIASGGTFAEYSTRLPLKNLLLKGHRVPLKSQLFRWSPQKIRHKQPQMWESINFLYATCKELLTPSGDH